MMSLASTLLILLAVLLAWRPDSVAAEPGDEVVAPDTETSGSPSGLEEASVLASADGATITVIQSVLGNQTSEVGVHRHVGIEGSYNDGRGVFLTNQDAGNFTNQANVVAVVVGRGESLGQVLSLSVGQERADDDAVASVDASAELSISSSFNGTRGIVGVNQSTGSGNNQLNAAVVAVGFAGGGEVVVVNDHELAAERSNEDLPPPELPDADTIQDSFQGFQGIAQVSQVNGSLNDVRNVLSVSVTAGGQP